MVSANAVGDMDYKSIFTFENLYKAHLKARMGKRNKEDVILFENNLSYHLWSLLSRLRRENYFVSGYHTFRIYEPKEREIQALQYKDRVVQHCLCDNYLYPKLTSGFIKENAACQIGKGTDFARRLLADSLREQYKKHGVDGYILKADVHHFFPSIDHAVLKSMLAPRIEDPAILRLLYRIVDSFHATDGRGVPMGNQTSQLFALLYLDPLDKLVKQKLRIRHYVRYMDDCLLIHKDKAVLQDCLAKMTALVQDELHLEWNAKTQIVPIKNGVEFLGFRFAMTETGRVVQRLRTSSKKRYKRCMRKLANDYADGRIEAEDIRKVLAGYKGHLKRADAYHLQKYVQKQYRFKRKSENKSIEE